MLMTVSFSAFQDISIKPISVSVMKLCPTELSALQQTPRNVAVQDYRVKGPTWEGHKDTKAIVNDCHIDLLLSCRRNMSLACWWLHLRAVGQYLWSAGAWGSGWGSQDYQTRGSIISGPIGHLGNGFRSGNGMVGEKPWKSQSRQMKGLVNSGMWVFILNFMELKQVFMLWTM